MTNENELEQLTLKDLKKLAGEHRVPNRSTLNKSQLLGALKDLLAQAAEGADSSENTAEEAAQPEPVDMPAASPEPQASQETASFDEPEVLDPAAIAALASAEISEDADVSPADSEVSQDEATSESQSDSAENTESETGEEGEQPKRKRRRRRRRRKKNGDEQQATEGEGDAESEASVEPADAADTPAGSEAAADETDSAAAARSEAPVEEAETATAEDSKLEESKSDAAGKPKRDRSRKPKRPRLAGQQRPVPPVLDRLKDFAAGILELCDPDTPGWAQARLGELLAGSGVVPTPCEGKPHSDFHDVVGEQAGDGVEAGSISVVQTPGFSLRGDRGDLFPLRKATVLVAPGGVADDAPADENPAPVTEESPAPTKDEPEAPAKPEGSAAEPAQAAAGDSDGSAEVPPAEAEPTDEATPDQAEATDTSAATEAEPAPEAPRRRSRRRGKAEPVESAPEPEAATTGEADDKDQADSTSAQVDGDEPSADADAVVEAAPATEKPRRNRRGRKASKAPTLPLQPQEAEELAARPKAEGFRALGLNEQILADLVDVGYENPSPIQAAAIPVVLEGKDVIGQALTGTGKTAAFSLPALDKLYRLEGEGPVALVLCPTRELARQVHAEVTRMAGKSGARACLVYGGVSLEDQVDALNLNPHIVIGTPGRIIDHMRRRNLDTSRMGLVVLDEADQMLDIGFLPDITYILKHTPPSRQTMLFSATMPDEIKKLASDYMSNPEHVHTMPEAATVAKVDQKYIAVDQNKKTTLLAHFIEVREPKQMVVFCKTKHQTDRVAKVLKQKDLSAGAIHGDLPQSKRERTLRDFRDGSLQCLIATNVAARGLDIPSVSHVVNYDVPETPEEYVHRIGRTGRMGKDGIARTFVTPEDGQFLLEIEKHIGLLLEEEIVEGITASTATEVKRTIAAPTKGAPRLLKPIAGGIRLGRRRR